ncbi:MAG: undecaprenyl-phosphate glucose phosphotransferase [Chloroflexaceae bacterium]|nr:undecaprenyl-phosphate glucose phosphotransferase [Chloroflexaceae bacterium]
MFCDAIAVNAAFFGVYRQAIPSIRNSGLLLPEQPEAILLYVLIANLVFFGAYALNGLYMMRRGSSRVDELYKIFIAISLATVILVLVVNTLLPEVGYAALPWTPSVLAVAWVVAIVLAATLRLIHRSLVIWLRSKGIDTRRALIVGARTPGLAVWRTIRRSPELGYRVQGFLSDNYPLGTVIEGLPVLGRINQVGRVVRATRADEVVLAISQRSPEEMLNIVALAEDEAVSIKVYPDTFQLITSNEVSIGDLSGLPLISVRNAALENPWNQFLKRGLDIVVSSIVLILASPLMVLVALLVLLDSGWPVFFVQERVGMDGKPFYMIKFRTMHSDAEKHGQWTVPGDPRVTRVGHFLRRYSLDELPQFINVLIGDMSVVGPRPEQPKWVEHFSQQIPRYMRRHKEKAGITGWAQVNGLRGDTSIEERTRYDLYYIENWSLLLDIKIIVRTTLDILTGKQENAY